MVQLLLKECVNSVMMKRSIKIDVVSDIACPWCYIGKKRLEKAMESSKDDFDFEVHFQPFQLDSKIPLAGLDWVEYFEGKFGSMERLDSIFHRVESAGKSVGVNFDFRSIPRIPNTLSLHVILEQAKLEGIQHEVANVLFDAYMVHPKNLTDVSTIQEVMSKFGWAPEKTEHIISDAQKIEMTKAKINSMQKLGISGVPFFIINDTYGISGAQPEEVLVQAFREVADVSKDSALNNSCDIGQENC